IELGEIETVVRQHPAIREAIVVVREDDPNGKYLVAYFVADNSYKTEELIGEVRSFIKERLPQYMIPSDFVLIAKIPLAPSGKVDRNALPAPDRTSRQQEFVPPRNPTEESIADIWCQIFKREKIGIYDDFFDLGGHSLLATQVISRLREAFLIDLPIRSLFEQPNVAQLAEYIATTSQMVEQISRSPIPEAKGRKKIKL
ncbi:MAG: phosphopantetheine-binding protein, partial [Cyanobacteria bacterium J06638_38]